MYIWFLQLGFKNKWVGHNVGEDCEEIIVFNELLLYLTSSLYK